ncbi:MAG: hypothetical protein HYW07_13505 [Candidatus Latescibacteria bacterium]|nr:hypothetical protein [Candidatus Latescibacterota bacterium]
MTSPKYDRSVFINCPFDAAYRPLFEALVFAVYDCGYLARCALEIDDASQVRIEKVEKIIAACKFGIHDISRTEADAATGLPRFNMPLELGIFLGAKQFGRAEQKNKVCLILDTERYRYQKFLSDISGQDISEHRGDPKQAIRVVRNWLSNATPKSMVIPGGTAIAERYALFRLELPAMCGKLRLKEDELTFNDYVVLVEQWLKLNAQVGLTAP